MTLGNLFGLIGLRAMYYDLGRCTARRLYLMPAGDELGLAANDPRFRELVVVRIDRTPEPA